MTVDIVPRYILEILIFKGIEHHTFSRSLCPPKEAAVIVEGRKCKRERERERERERVEVER